MAQSVSVLAETPAANAAAEMEAIQPLSGGTVVLYATANFGANCIYAFANLAFPLYLSAYPVPQWLVGLLAQERSFVGGFIQPAVGWLSDRLPPNRLGRRKPFFLVGVPLTAASLLVLASYPALPVVIGLLTIFSFFLSTSYDPYLALLADIAPSEQRARVGGVMAVGVMLATIVVIGLSFLWWQTQPGLVFLSVAVLLVASFAVTFFGITEPRSARQRMTSLATRVAQAETIREPVDWPPLLLFLAATFCFWLGNGGIVPFVTRFGVDVLGTEERIAFLLVLPAVVGAAIFAVPSGMLAERFGKQPVLVVGQAIFGLSALAGGLLVDSVPKALLLMSLVGVGNAIATALTFPLLTELIPRSRAGTFTGIGNMVWSLAQPIGAVAAGLLADQTGTLRGAFALGGGFMLASAVLTTLVRMPRR